MGSSRVAPLLLLAVLVRSASAQSVVEAGTTLAVDSGTTLRVDAPITWSIAAGATVLNNGTIILSPAATLQEEEGSPITGSGTERTTHDLNGPLSSVDPSGLGLELSTNIALGTTTLIRGHVHYTDTADASSIERWYRVLPTNNTGLAASVGFNYDPTELNGISELDQAVHIATAGDTVWTPLNSVVSSAQRRVDAGPVDSLGLFTTFELVVPQHIDPDTPGNDRPHLAPNIASDRVVLHLPAGQHARWLEIVTADGRSLGRSSASAQEQLVPVEIGTLASGRYFLRLEDGTTLPFVKR